MMDSKQPQLIIQREEKELVHFSLLQAEVMKRFSMERKTFQLYVKEGLIPQPIYIEEQAYYEIDLIKRYVHLVDFLQERFNLKLLRIKKLFDRYLPERFEEIDKFFHLLYHKYCPYGFPMADLNKQVDDLAIWLLLDAGVDVSKIAPSLSRIENVVIEKIPRGNLAKELRSNAAQTQH